MSSDAYLVLCLDAPLQSWGASSRFARRTTELHPSKSAVLGMICAALGADKGSEGEKRLLESSISMTSIAIPRGVSPRRMEDFHTVLGTRRASGTMNRNPVVTWRQFLLDARFGVILKGERPLLSRVADAMRNPVWGIWFGRKCCIPAAPIFRGLFDQQEEAVRSLIGERAIEEFARVEEVDDFASGTDSLNDQPVSFGQAMSSSEGREFALRRIRFIPASLGEQD